MPAYSTALAAEFHILSVLHRLGLDATLTLGNRKQVDIVVVGRNGTALTIDVKGTAGCTGWFVKDDGPGTRHFVAFVTFLGRIARVEIAPEVYVIPSDALAELVRTHPSGKRVLHANMLRKRFPQYRDAWHLVESAFAGTNAQRETAVPSYSTTAWKQLLRGTPTSASKE